MSSHLVYSFGHYPAYGHGHIINDLKHLGFVSSWLHRRVFVFSMGVDEAKFGEQQGCEFLTWVAPKDAATGKWLRANLDKQFLNSSTFWRVSFDWVDEPDERWRIGTETLTILASAEDPAGGEINTRPINEDPSSQFTFSKARGWLYECLTTHEYCQNLLEEGYMPRRLLRVRGSISAPLVNLIITDSRFKPAPYAALSYCWGRAQSVVLEKKRLDNWLSSLPYCQLPQTLKDAIKVTQELGLQYLWVDALCIIQDDPADKEAQIAGMANIYSQAQITIAASRANSVDDGFLKSRDTGPAQGGFRLPFRCSNGQLGYTSLLNPYAPVGYGYWSEPLDQRGWTIQEALLSTRTLEYGTMQLRWTCRSKHDGPGYVDGWLAAKNEPRPSRFDWNLVAECTPENCDVMVPIWHLLVGNYSQRHLSEPGDKLLALSGLARKIERLSGMKYVAGLWKNIISQSLLWHLQSKLGQYPIQYRAPSWSWASVDGDTVFYDCEIYRITVINVDVETTTNDSFGSIVSAFLEVKARVMEVGINDRGELVSETELDEFAYYDVSGNFLESDSNRKMFTLLEVGGSLDHGQMKPSGLILREGDDSLFRRIGIFKLHCVKSRRNPFDQCEERVLTIV
ncbi:HET domain-containing protein [Rutstroemia sp. NJR-2017a BVV2]|nr:HET domain-containing protein [Rutstroemia sp. NJR-2017a BVV2]